MDKDSVSTEPVSSSASSHASEQSAADSSVIAVQRSPNFSAGVGLFLVLSLFLMVPVAVLISMGLPMEVFIIVIASALSIIVGVPLLVISR